jgi:osmotically-inducible protein OsmY
MRLPRKWVLSLGLMAAAPGIASAGPLDFLRPAGSQESGATAPRSNQEIAEAVAGAFRDAKLSGKDIAIEVKGGVCTLEGQIADSQQRAAATRVVSAVPGVESVDNRLTLMQTAGAPQDLPRTSGVQQAGFDGAPQRNVQQVNHTAAPVSNDQVAREVANAVAGSGVQGYDIEVRYKSGVAALLGDVGSAQEAAIAEEAARSVTGVDQVLNRLTVNGQPVAPQTQQYQPQYQPPYQQGVPAMPAGYPQMTQASQPGPAMPPYGPGVPPGPAPAPGAPAVMAGHMIHNQPNVPEYAWPAYAPYDNYAQVSYPSAYDASAWPYIGPFYPYPQVPMEWRSAQLVWDDGFWQLKFHSRTDRWWWFLDPHNWQ